MSVASSSYVTDAHQQIGGGRWTVETHTDTDGTKYTVGPYMWDGIANRDTLLAAHAAQIDQSLADAEAQQQLGG